MKVSFVLLVAPQGPLQSYKHHFFLSIDLFACIQDPNIQEFLVL